MKRERQREAMTGKKQEPKKKESAFARKCKQVDPDVMLPGTLPYSPPCEDDGNLHVIDKRTGEWAIFGIGQDTPPVQANDRIRFILACLGLDKAKNFDWDRVLTDEQDADCDDHEHCPHCGECLD